MLCKKENDGLIASFCCGYDDCAVAEIEVENQRQQGIAVENNPSCTVKKESISATPTKQSGKQIAVTRPQTCEASPACTHSIQLSYSFTAAVANFFAYTWTDEIGTEVSSIYTYNRPLRQSMIMGTNIGSSA